MNRTFSRAGSYPLHSSDWPVLVLLVSGSMVVFAYLARDSHRRVEADAMLASIDLTRAIGTEIDRNLASVKLVMEATVKALQIPNIWNTDPELRNAVGWPGA